METEVREDCRRPYLEKLRIQNGLTKIVLFYLLGSSGFEGNTLGISHSTYVCTLPPPPSSTRLKQAIAYITI